MLHPMDSPDRFELYDAMLRSRATPLRSALADAGGAWLVHWRNADTETVYRQPDNHTLSLYLRGGESVRCLDEPDARGAAGSLCCMPAGHESRWVVRGSLELLHLYMPGLPLARAAECWFDVDPRHATLSDRIYFEDPALSGLGRQLVSLDWEDPLAGLQIQHLVMQMQARLLTAHTGMRRTAARRAVRGGLSAAARRRVIDRVEASPASPPSLAELAATACLSEFHFARMFKESFGMAPHAWVMQRRLAQARLMLAQDRLKLSEVARQAGYAHPSHLNAALRRAGLGSAARYREAVQGLD